MSCSQGKTPHPPLTVGHWDLISLAFKDTLKTLSISQTSKLGPEVTHDNDFTLMFFESDISYRGGVLFLGSYCRRAGSYLLNSHTF